jgi:hypothetical protein
MNAQYKNNDTVTRTMNVTEQQRTQNTQQRKKLLYLRQFEHKPDVKINECCEMFRSMCYGKGPNLCGTMKLTL